MILWLVDGIQNSELTFLNDTFCNTTVTPSPQVAQAELADVNIAFQAHIATDDEEDSEDGSIAGTSCKDPYHIGEGDVCHVCWNFALLFATHVS